MKGQWKKLTCGLLCLTMLSGCAAAGLQQSSADPAEAAAQTTVNYETPATRVVSGTEGKDETVYVLTDAAGAVQSVIVSDRLGNPEGRATIHDVSDLTDIENVDGSETFTQDGSSLTWNAAGNAISYRGVSRKTPPVTMKVRYFLDGAELSAADIAGKSGHVTIRYEFSNNEKKTVSIDGKQETLCVPFAVLTGLMLDGEHFSDVTVSNGKLIDDGSRTFAVGLAFPGLQEDLALAEEKLELPSAVEITAEVTDFTLGMGLTLVTNEPFNAMDPDKLTQRVDAEGLEGSMDQLAEGMNQLLDGSSALYNGLCTLLEKSNELSAGVDALAEGALKLKNGSLELAGGAGTLAAGAQDLNTGAGTLADGAQTLAGGADKLAAGAASLNEGTAAVSSGASALSAGAKELADGAQALANGLAELDANSAALSGGALQVFNTLLATAQTQITAAGLDCPTLTVSNYAEVLNALIASLDEDAVYRRALEAVTAAVEAKRDEITALVTAAVREQVEGQVTAAVRENVEAQVTAAVREQLRPQVVAAVRAQVRAQVEAAVRENVTAQVVLAATGLDMDSYNAAVAAGQISEEVQAAIQAQIEAQMASESVQQTIETQTDAQMQSDAVLETIEQQLELVMSGAEAQGAIAAAVDQQMQSEQVQQTVAALVEQQMNSQEIQDVIAQNVEAQIQKAIADTMAGPEVQAQLAAASEGAQRIIALKTSLDSYNAFYLGLVAYTNGVSTAAAGARKLAAGTEALKSGAYELSSGASDLAEGALAFDAGAKELAGGADRLAAGALSLADGSGKLASGAAALRSGADTLANGQASLYDGIAKLQAAMPALKDGVTQLRDGAMALSDGLQTFYDEGISKLLTAVEGKLPALLDRLRAISSVSNAYQSFTGLSQDMTGTVKFIYRTEEINN